MAVQPTNLKAMFEFTKEWYLLVTDLERRTIMNYLIELFTNLEEDKVIEAVKDEIKKDTDLWQLLRHAKAVW